MTPEEFANKVGGAVFKSGSWYCLCPGHDDQRPSLKVDGPGEKVEILIHCTSAGCDSGAVIALLKERGLWEFTQVAAAPALPKKRDRREPIIPVPTDAPPCPMLGDDPKLYFAYDDEEGRLLGYTRRFEQGNGEKEFKVFTYCRLDGKVIGWQGKGWSAPKPLFGLGNLGKAKKNGERIQVIMFEGERKARAAQLLFDKAGNGWVALSISGGTGGHTYMDLGPLDGCNVTYWPDAGEKKVAATYAKKLGSAHFSAIKIPSWFPEGWDIVDAILGASAEKLSRPCEKWTNAQVLRFIESRGAEFPEHMAEPVEPEPEPEVVEEMAAAWETNRYFDVLGTDGGNGVWIRHKHSGLVANYSAMALTESNLVAFAEGSILYWEMKFAAKKGADWRKATAWIIATANSKGRYHPFAETLKVTAMAREFVNGEPTGYSKLLEWVASDGTEKKWLMHADMDGATLAGELQSRGFPPSLNDRERRELLEYVALQTPETRLRQIRATGWYGEAFAIPGEVFGRVEGESLFMQSEEREHPYKVGGTLEEWQANQGRLCVGNDYLVFGVSLAFVGPLLEPLGLKGFGVNLAGKTSKGKTKVEEIACSIWGNRAYLHSWRNTAQHIEFLAVGHTGCLFALDDTSMSDLSDYEMGQLAYSLAWGVSKGGMQRDGETQRKLRYWLVVWLTSGEKRLIDLYNSTRTKGERKVMGGAFVRLIDLATPAFKYGLFQNIWDAPVGPPGAEGQPFVNRLTELCDKFYGAPSRHFLAALTADKDALVEWAKAKRDTVLKELPIPNGEAAQEVSRVAEIFATIAAAGEIAIKIGTLTWEEGMPTATVKRIYAHWVRERAGSSAPSTETGFDTTAMLRQFRDQVLAGWQAHSQSRAGGNSRERIPVESWGFHNIETSTDEQSHSTNTFVEGGNVTVFMYPGAFEKLLTGYDPDRSVEALHKAGYLKFPKKTAVRVLALGPGSDGRGKAVKLWHVLIGSLLGDDRAKIRAGVIEHTKLVIGGLEGLFAAAMGDAAIAAQIDGLKKTLDRLQAESEDDVTKKLLDFWVEWTEREKDPPTKAEQQEVLDLFSATRAAHAARKNKTVGATRITKEA